MGAKYRAGVIGRTGRGDYGHGLDRVYLHMDEIDLVAVADDDPEGLQAAGERLGCSRQYDDYRRMLEEEELDIVSVCCRWMGPHRDMVVAAAEAGAHVFLEKPISPALREADEMIEACDRAGVGLGIAHQGRMHGLIRYARNLLKDGVIGDVLTAALRGKEDRRGGGEDLIVLGTHAFDTLRFMLEADPLWVFAHVSMADGRPVTRADAVDGPEEAGPIAGDHIHALYGMSNGATATFESRRHQSDPSLRFGVQLFGTEGVMTISGLSRQILVYEEPVWTPGRSPAVRDVSAEAMASLSPEEQKQHEDLSMTGNIAIVREILESPDKVHLASSARNGRWSLEMIHGIYASHLAGQRMDLPLTERDNPLA